MTAEKIVPIRPINDVQPIQAWDLYAAVALIAFILRDKESQNLEETLVFARDYADAMTMLREASLKK